MWRFVTRIAENARRSFFQTAVTAFFFNETCNARLLWSETADAYTYLAECTPDSDYFLFVGSPQEVVSAYRRLTGHTALLPKQAFGYIQSRNRYRNEEELLYTADRFQEKGIPLDGLVIDYKWWGENNPWNNLSWSKKDWPDPEKMTAELEARQIPLAVSVWADFEPESRPFEAFHKRGLLLKPRPQTNRYAYDPSSEQARRLYWDFIDKAVVSKGVRSVWLDANEPEPSEWESAGTDCSLGNSLPYALCYPLFDAKALWDGQKEKFGGKRRVNTLSRAAVAGIQRYGIQSWSGDIPPTWHQLQQEIPGILNFHAAGLPWFSTDTGGYFGMNTADPDKRELFLRWLQLSCFTSIMRVHGRDCDKAPWCFGEEYERAIVWYIKLRERMIPYLYSEAIRCAVEDTIMVRPLAFLYPDDPFAAHIPDEFLLGPSLLVCPVSKKGAVSREVYLPEGLWYDFYSKAAYTGGQSILVDAPIEKIPVFAQAGTILPLGKANLRACAPTEELSLLVFSGKDGAYTLLEDDGETCAYESGFLSRILFQWNDAAHSLTIGERSGSFEGMCEKRRFRIIVISPDGSYRSGTVEYSGKAAAVCRFPEKVFCQEEIPAVPPRPTVKRLAEPHSVIGHWLFDENEGGAASDSSGNFNTGSIMSCDWCSGTSGSALSFNGYTSYVDCGDDNTLNVSRGITLFIRLILQSNGVILSKGGIGANAGYALCWYDGTLFFRMAGSDVCVLSASLPVSGNWTEITARWSAENGKAELVLNGETAASALFSGEIGATGDSLNFGRSTVLDENSFGGIIDEICIVNDWR